MTPLRVWLAYFRGLFDKERRDQDLSAELEGHVQLHIEDNLRAGMAPEEARRQALLRLGGVEQVKETCRERRGLPWLESLVQDIRFGVRMLRKNPGFTAVAVLTLALGIGATTAIFGVVNGVLIKPLPYPNPDRLVAVWHTAQGMDFGGRLPVSPAMSFTYREENKTFQEFGLYSLSGASVTGLGEPEQVRALGVTYGTLQALGVQPILGRLFSAADDSPGGTEPAPVILSYGYWQRKFGGDKNAIGRTMTIDFTSGGVIDSRARQIVGVMPRSFRFLDAEPELILTLRLDRNRAFLGQFNYAGIARLKPGVTVIQANADVQRMLGIWINEWPPFPGATREAFESMKIAPKIRPLKEDLVGDTRSVLWVVMGTVGLVLLIACANVANLLLVRTAGRQQELGIRAALGAGRGRIVRELVVESFLLALLGGIVGLGLAYGGLQLLLTIGPANLPRLGEISIDPVVLAFGLGASLFSGLFFGVAPAWKYGRTRAATALRSGGRTSTPSRESNRARDTLVVVQVALALVLLVSSGLMIRTFRAMRNVQPGFLRPEDLQTIRISIPPSQVQDPEQVARMQNAIRDKIAAIPGVSAVAFSGSMPMDGFFSGDVVWAEDKTYPAGQFPPGRRFKWVSPGYFESMGTRLIAGRDFTWTDVYGHRPVTMVSENMARELWGEPAAAVGKRIRIAGPGAPDWREIVGVVEDVRDDGVQQKAPTIVYWPFLMENFWGDSKFIVRSVAFSIRSKRAGNDAFLNEVSQAVWSVNPNLPLAMVRTMQDVYNRSMAETSFTLVMLGIAGVMALALGMIGIYGVVSYLVSQRTHEIGIRMALGAQPRDIVRGVLGDGGRMATLGIALGLAASIGLTRLMTSMLFGVSATDPITFAAVVLLLLAVALVASWIPAHRAMRVDPMVALRYE
jgi:putative ABC transport system permease protein